MNGLTLNAQAKINWRLLITGRRQDGYHELDMLMQTISLCDTLRMEPSCENVLIVNGETAAQPEKNLIIRAAQKLGAYTNKRICAKFVLTKRIPSMAGLGGGSSDCAQTLIGLNRLYELGLSQETLASIALSLGADVPFFLKGGLCRIGGIGEKVEKCASSSPRAQLLLYHVSPGLSTPAVYKKYDECSMHETTDDTNAFIESLLGKRFSCLEARNDLEAPAIELLPRIGEVKRTMRALGAVYSLMSGSGSAVYGVFEDETLLVRAHEALSGSLIVHTTD